MLMALGDYRVGIDFNPSGSDDVNRIKRLAADLINFLELKRDQMGGDPEVGRLLSLAQTHSEDAAMWGVKAVTKQLRRPATPGPLRPA